ncbi:MAG: hypothetical protein H0V81_17690 [Solirubrobacterales bacterium]|nr:hypothetical protein [Solirubrobacterales bacterium]
MPLAEDAQSFIDSIKAFQNKTETKTKTETSIEKPFLEPVTYKGFDFTKWPKKKLDFRKEAITFIEVFFFTHNRLPVLQDFKQSNLEGQPANLSDWQDFLVSIEESLSNRGIPPYETPQAYLEPKFVFAVNSIVNPHDKRTIPAKLKEVELSTKQWTALLRNPVHLEYYQTRLNAIFNEDAQNDAKVALHRMIVGGDLQAIKHFHEMQNIYRPNQDTNQLLITVLKTVMEILAMHVAPDVLGKVAQALRQSEAIPIEMKAS